MEKAVKLKGKGKRTIRPYIHHYALQLVNDIKLCRLRQTHLYIELSSAVIE